MKKIAIPALLLTFACTQSPTESDRHTGVNIIGKSLKISEITDEISVQEANLRVYNAGNDTTVVLRLSLDCEGNTLKDSIVFKIAKGDTVSNDFIFGACSGSVVNPTLTAEIGYKGK